MLAPGGWKLFKAIPAPEAGETGVDTKLGAITRHAFQPCAEWLWRRANIKKPEFSFSQKRKQNSSNIIFCRILIKILSDAVSSYTAFYQRKELTHD